MEHRPNRVTEVPPGSERSAATPASVPPGDLREGLLRFRRLMAERGITVKLPRMTPDPDWRPPPVLLPIEADEMSAFLVHLRHTGRL